MKLTHKKGLVLIVTVIIIVTIFSLFVLYNKRGGITAKEAEAIAKNEALEWSKNATLFRVDGIGEYVAEGKCTLWRCGYYKCPEIVAPMPVMWIKVYDNGKCEKYEKSANDLFIHDFKPVHDWVIDSDTAYRIALANDTIREYIENYSLSNPKIYFFTLSCDGNTSVWSIQWSTDPGFDVRNIAYIGINATSGMVIYATLYLESPPPKLCPFDNPIFMWCCFLPGIIGVIILIAVVVWKVKMRIEEKDRKKAYQELKQKWEEKK